MARISRSFLKEKVLKPADEADREYVPLTRKTSIHGKWLISGSILFLIVFVILGALDYKTFLLDFFGKEAYAKVFKEDQESDLISYRFKDAEKNECLGKVKGSKILYRYGGSEYLKVKYLSFSPKINRPVNYLFFPFPWSRMLLISVAVLAVNLGVRVLVNRFRRRKG